LRTKTLRKLFFLLLAVTLTACGSAATPTVTPHIVPTSAPTVTTAVPTLLLVVPPDADPALAAVAGEVAAAYAAERGLVFEQSSALDAAAIPSNVTKVAYFPNASFDPALVSSPISLVAIGQCESAATNVIALCLTGNASEQAAFVAGYVAALTADDWRVGMLYSPASASTADDFQAGAEYYCGSCIPLSPPPGEFPLASQAADPTNWQSAADELLLNFTRVVYLTPEMATSGAATYLANYSVLFIGTGTPPDALVGSWIASISADPADALRQQLLAALDGQIPAASGSLALTNMNSAYISEARLANIQTVIADLLSGFILLPTD
jgi:hypothetical protein